MLVRKYMNESLVLAGDLALSFPHKKRRYTEIIIINLYKEVTLKHELQKRALCSATCATTGASSANLTNPTLA